ncbi:hypothetical protein [Qipengyuania vesicularis]|uniref:hypothetical protein n=1 Tax=Qipengyuania vesicularis TaxID=2867232 RepID=UPI001C87D2F0|nr:hypothetical protein [Qipengyuania vesicularis]MBX7527079.1 hypothetical protein [Qipengyuania vesicularis]
MIRIICLIAMVALSAACNNQQNDERLRNLLFELADLPSCDVEGIRPVARIPGGGVEGKGYDWRFTGSKECMSRWFQDLDRSAEYSCFPGIHEHTCKPHRQPDFVAIYIKDGAVSRIVWIKE